MIEIKPGEIIYCDITAKGKQTYSAKNVTISRNYDEEFKPILSADNICHSIILKHMNCKENQLTITSIVKHHSSGFKVRTKEFSEVKASDEKRNIITGAYE